MAALLFDFSILEYMELKPNTQTAWFWVHLTVPDIIQPSLSAEVNESRPWKPSLDRMLYKYLSVIKGAAINSPTALTQNFQLKDI